VGGGWSPGGLALGLPLPAPLGGPVVAGEAEAPPAGGDEAVATAGSALAPNPAVDATVSPNACALTSGVAAASVRIASRCCGVHSPSAW
jgi:hypothetical protein